MSMPWAGLIYLQTSWFRNDQKPLYILTKVNTGAFIFFVPDSGSLSCLSGINIDSMRVYCEHALMRTKMRKT